MPVLGGRQLAERLLALHPEMKVLFQSGYTDDAVVRHGVLQEKVHFLQKPYSPAALARRFARCWTRRRKVVFQAAASRPVRAFLFILSARYMHECKKRRI